MADTIAPSRPVVRGRGRLVPQGAAANSGVLAVNSEVPRLVESRITIGTRREPWPIHRTQVGANAIAQRGRQVLASGHAGMQCSPTERLHRLIRGAPRPQPFDFLSLCSHHPFNIRADGALPNRFR